MTGDAPDEPRTVAIFGGSFNPPHLAHVLAVTAVLATEEVHELLVIPTFQHPFAKPLAPFDARVAMCRLAMEWLPRVIVSRVEEELGGDSLTLRTLEHLQAKHPSWRMRLVMGADLVLEADKWFRFDRVKALAPPLVLGRAGVDLTSRDPRGATSAPKALLPAISSTAIREHVAAGRWDELHGLVPRTVLAYVKDHRLYGAA